MNKVVAHTRTGELIKGITNDFLPTKDRFHLVPEDGAPGSRPLEILLTNLKALFFVKDLTGDFGHAKSNLIDPHLPHPGRPIRIVFQDGETMVATTQGYLPGRPGFFVVPVDPKSNNERCYIVTAATQEITLL